MPSLMFAIDSDDNILDDIESVGTDYSIASDVYDYDIDMPELIDGVNILNNIYLLLIQISIIMNTIFLIMMKTIFHIIIFILHIMYVNICVNQRINFLQIISHIIDIS
jgi:hypothetical protein